MILSMDALRKYDFHLSQINIIHQKPQYRNLSIKNRSANSFLVILNGSCCYRFEEGSFDLCAGSVVYLPYGSTHTLEIISEKIEFYRIDFRITLENEIVRFSNYPQKICRTMPDECAEAVQALADNCQFVQDSIRKAELMCTILRTLSANVKNPQKERLAPAIRYLLEHLTESVDCSVLAQLCSLSSSQFYNLFRAEYGMAPLAYRNSLLMHRAKVLLRDGSFSVKEVAQALGFESVSYFSRFFRKHHGISPSGYSGQS